MANDLTIINSTALNLVQAVNALANTYLDVQGSINHANITGNLVVMNGPGRVASVSVTTLGNSTGAIYDGSALGQTLRPIYVIANSIGVQVVNFPLSYGLLVVAGTGNMTVAVSYSPAGTAI